MVFLPLVRAIPWHISLRSCSVPFQRKGIFVSREAKGFRSPFPLVLRDFSTQGHIVFHEVYITKHKCDRSK